MMNDPPLATAKITHQLSLSPQSYGVQVHEVVPIFLNTQYLMVECGVLVLQNPMGWLDALEERQKGGGGTKKNTET